MNSVAFVVFIVYFLKISFAQCPKDEKPSKLLPEKCLKANACDGYVSRMKPNVCSQKDISTSEDSKFIKCEIAEGKDTEYTLYVCDECIRLGENRIQCNNCKDDEYSLTYQPGKCIKKLEFGKYSGYLNDDYATIVSKCKSNQIITENVYRDEQQISMVVIQQLCLTCPKEKPYVSIDKTQCFDIQDYDYIIDLREPNQQTVIKRSSCSFFSSDASACVAKCQPEEITFQVTQNVKICKLCFGSKPYASIDKASCLSECPEGTFLSEDQKNCIPNANCVGFLNVSRRACYKTEQCQPKQIGNIPVSFRPTSSSKQCFDCPENKVFIKSNSQCYGCLSTQTLVLPAQVCVDNAVLLDEERKRLKEIELGISLKGTFNTIFTVLYPPNYCPPEHKIYIGITKLPKQEYCYPCTKLNQKIIQQHQCCEKGQFFDKISFKCVNVCEIVGPDFTCLPQCKEDEVLKQVLYEYEKDGKYYEKQINQCISCNDPRVYLEDVSQNIPILVQKLLKNCIYIRLCGPQKDNKVVNSQLCSQPTKICPSFSPDKGEPSTYYDKVQNKCISCPPDKPFLEQKDNNFSCTRCLTKIRDYASGMCVEMIEQIFNPGAGVFKYNHLEYWPKTECSNSFQQFNYKLMGLKECYQKPEQSSDCKSKQIYDSRTKTCIDQPEKCSLVLSSDRSKCELNPCIDDEVYQTLKIDKNDPQFAIKTNNGYLYQCQSLKCPAEKPYVQSGICTASCNEGYFLYYKICLTQKECPKLLSSSKLNCVDKCEKQEIYYKNKENILQCFKCDITTPFTLNNTCLKECPEKYFTEQNEYECKQYSECKGAIDTKTKQCLFKCPNTQEYQQEQDEDFNSFKICVQKCNPGYYGDSVTQQCIRDEKCQKVLEGQKCIDQCSEGYGKKQRANSNIIDCISCQDEQMIYQDGICKKICGQFELIDEETQKCIIIRECRYALSNDKMYCVKSCSFGQYLIKYSDLYPQYKCEICPKDKPYSEGSGKAQICTAYCRIRDASKSDLPCLPNFSSCKTYVFEQTFGGYICEKDCPQIGFIQKTIIESPNSQYKFCKKCSQEEPISFEGRCYSECPSNSLPIGSEIQPLQCEKCPDDKPIADFNGQSRFCTIKCRIRGIDFKCLRDFQSCKNNLIAQSDGTYTCEEFCPQFGFIKEKICNEKGEQCYFVCKKCPEKSPFGYKGQCFKECPSPTVSIPDFLQCALVCPVSHVYDLDDEECNKFEFFIRKNKNLGIQYKNFRIQDNNIRLWSRKCPSSYTSEEQNICFPIFVSEDFYQSYIDYFYQLPKKQLDQQISPVIYSRAEQFYKDQSPYQALILLGLFIQSDQFDTPSIFNLSKSRMRQIYLELSNSRNSQQLLENNYRKYSNEIYSFNYNYLRTCTPLIPQCVKQTGNVQSNLFKEESTENKLIIEKNNGEINQQSNGGNEDDNNDEYKIIIISICALTLILILVFIVYFVHKRYRIIKRKASSQKLTLQNERSNKMINQEEEKISNYYSKPSTVTHLKEEIESQQEK